MANNNQIPANDAAQLVELNIAGLNERMSKRLTMNVHGANDTIISEKLRNEQCWEPYETHLVVTHFHPGGVFLDIGANIGYYTLLASAIAGQEGQVLSLIHI